MQDKEVWYAHAKLQVCKRVGSQANAGLSLTSSGASGSSKSSSLHTAIAHQEACTLKSVLMNIEKH